MPKVIEKRKHPTYVSFEAFEFGQCMKQNHNHQLIFRYVHQSWWKKKKKKKFIIRYVWLIYTNALMANVFYQACTAQFFMPQRLGIILVTTNLP